MGIERQLRVSKINGHLHLNTKQYDHNHNLPLRPHSKYTLNILQICNFGVVFISEDHIQKGFSLSVLMVLERWLLTQIFCNALKSVSWPFPGTTRQECGWLRRNPSRLEKKTFKATVWVIGLWAHLPRTKAMPQACRQASSGVIIASFC